MLLLRIAAILLEKLQKKAKKKACPKAARSARSQNPVGTARISRAKPLPS